MKTVGVCANLLSVHRKEKAEFTGTWESLFDERGVKWEYVDCYDYNIIKNLKNYSAIVWHYSNFVNADLMEAQNILNIAAKQGVKVFPDYNTGWHFDDKIAEMYAFEAVGAPIPESWVFYDLKKCLEWLKNEAEYPLVAKLRRGSGANNVKLLHNFSQANRYAKKMFSKGFSPMQSLVYKTYSKVQSTHDWKTFVKRFKRIPDFLWARRYGKGMPAERGYCYFQQFIENDGYDLKVVATNGKCSFLTRNVRKHDFRASGGGEICYDKALINDRIVRSAFETADALKMQCVGFDYVVDKKTGNGLIVEMCHGFDYDAIYQCGGYWDRELVWHDEPLNARVEIFEEMQLDR
ncbi:MAG: hypothetical protein VB068_12740 [Petrimonas sp.]|nr:hypothetical protein [Christensenella sp.]MEA4950489.1 hypothetical protein [Petrimonas sp.]